MNPRSPILRLFCLLAAVPLAAAAQLESIRLSVPTAWTSELHWFGPSWSPDGEWLVFSHDATVENADELWAVRRAGGEPVRLSFSLPTGIGPATWKISPDSRWVVYRLDQESSSVEELWSVPIGGPSEAAVKLHPAAVPGGDVAADWEISSDGERVVFLGDLAVDGRFELWSAPIDGSAPAVRLSPDAVAGSSVSHFRISPDGSRVLLRADLEADERFELWSVPIEGPSGAAEKLHATPIANGDVTDDFRFSADGARAIFRADLVVDDLLELWSAPIDGPADALVKLNPVATPNGDVFSFRLPLAGERLVFLGDLATDGTIELWSVPIAGPAADAVQLNPAPVAGGGAGSSVPRFTPDGSRVLFVGDLRFDGIDELWSVPVAGPADVAVRLNPAPVAGGRVANGAWEVSPDGARVIFMGDLALFNRFELWSAAVDGAEGSAVAISGSIVANGDVGGFVIAPDSQRVVFDGDLGTDTKRMLWSTRVDATEGRLGHTTLAHNESDVFDYEIDAASTTIFFLLDHPVDEQLQLQRTDIDRAGFQRVNRVLEAGEQAASFALAPGGGGVAHRIGGLSTPTELWVADEWILHADFDEGSTAEWSSAAP